MRKKIAIFMCLLLVMSMVVASAVVVAKQGGGGGKPPKDPPPPPPEGTVFFQYNDDAGPGIWTMNADGSEKTLLGIDYSLVDGYKVYGAVSRGQHNDHYWFVRLQEVEGTYPDEEQRLEIFAVRDDGAMEVKLTDDPNLAMSRTVGPPIFGIGDDCVTWGAKTWIDDEEVPVYFGIFRAPIEYDIDGNIVGLSGNPMPIWDTGYIYNEVKNLYVPNLFTFDWSPDETEIVLVKRLGEGIHVVNLGVGQGKYLTDGYRPQWSPDGSKIAFTKTHNLRTINPDGTDEQIIVPGSSKGGQEKQVRDEIAWSLDSNYLVYTWNIWHKRGPGEQSFYVYRVDANGDHETCLTNDLPAAPYKASHTWR